MPILAINVTKILKASSGFVPKVSQLESLQRR